MVVNSGHWAPEDLAHLEGPGHQLGALQMVSVRTARKLPWGLAQERPSNRHEAHKRLSTPLAGEDGEALKAALWTVLEHLLCLGPRRSLGDPGAEPLTKPCPGP